jgi:hypothetical protein
MCAASNEKKQRAALLLISPQIFTRAEHPEKSFPAVLTELTPRKIARAMPASMRRFNVTAPNSVTPLVERLHSIACKRDKPPRFLLTIKMRGVKPISFFDTF